MKSQARYAYDKQVWIVDGKYQRCGHPDSMNCTCYGRKHAGEQVPAIPQRGSFVRMLGRLYLVDHYVDASTLAVYCCDGFGPYGSQVWINLADCDVRTEAK